MNAKKEKEYINMLRTQQVDGIFLASHTLDIAAEIKVDLPILSFDRKIEGLPYICSDNDQGGKLAAEHLLEQGAKKLAYIGGSLKLNLLSNQRYYAFKERAAEAGLIVENFQCQLDSFDRAQYQQLAANVFKKDKAIDGIFTSSDLIAAAVIKEAKDNMIKVPENLKVIGYDDIELAQLYSPEITTIRQSAENIAQKSVQLLLKSIAGENIDRKTVLNVELIKRKST